MSGSAGSLASAHDVPPEAEALRARESGIRLHADTDWYAWRRAAEPGDGAERAGRIGSPGLWKGAGARGEPGTLVFELPRLPAVAERLAAASAWALATAGGAAPPEWKAPSRAEVASWLGAGPAAVRSASSARPIDVVLSDGRFALRVLLAFPLAERLPPARRAWLDAFLEDALARTRCVRLGVAAAGDAVVAETDLTGVPPGLARPLAAAAAEALRWVAGSVLRPIEAITDPDLVCRMFEFEPPRVRPQRGEGA